MMVKKISPAFIISSLLLLAVLTGSLVLFFLQNNGVRRVFFFESLDDDRVYVESRIIPSYGKEDGVTVYEQYVQELISGTVTDRYRPLFDTAVSLESCMFRDGVLYVNLSEEALLASATSSSTEMACALLQKNILNNFSSVRKVYVFIHGLPVYAGSAEVY